MKRPATDGTEFVIPLAEFRARGSHDGPGWTQQVGSKAHWLAVAMNDADIAELGVVVPDGFVVTSNAYSMITGLGADAGTSDRSLPVAIREAISGAVGDLLATGAQVAVRSSASVEDGPKASFAGEFRSILGVSTHSDVLEAYGLVVESARSESALNAFDYLGIEADSVTMPVLVQRMVGSPSSVGGVLLSRYSTSGTAGVLIEAAKGGPRGVVSGEVDPVTLVVDSKGPAIERDPCGSQNLVPPHVVDTLSRLAGVGEGLVGAAVEIEWVWDPDADRTYLVQLRPLVDPSDRMHTIGAPHPPGSHTGAGSEPRYGHVVAASGLGVGTGVVWAEPLVARSVDEALEIWNDPRFTDGYVLVVDTTSPDWLPLIRGASAVVTDTGGRTSHAAIVCRELGIPAVLGCGTAVEAISRAEGLIGVALDDSGVGTVFVQKRSTDG
ncbi:MAG: hypothetical protein KDB26_06270 [Microthrixaceae bacterium]|nr:hypothetical protein [Microthrixaceae bacterium]